MKQILFCEVRAGVFDFSVLGSSHADKRPFPEETFQTLPEPVQQYIVQLEETVVRLLGEVEGLKSMFRNSKAAKRLLD